MLTLSRKVAGLAALALAFALGTSPVSAQQPEEGAQQCTAELAPAQIEAGAPAVELTVVLSEDVGEITALESPGSGIAVASPGDLPRTDMAAGERPQPISLAAQGNAWTIWVNTSQATAGTHEVAFIATDGQCRAQITVG